MKTIVVHNRYKVAGGEELSSRANNDLLNHIGVRSEYVEFYNSDIKSPITAVSAAVSINRNRRIGQQLRELFENRRPDIVFVHNFFPLISPVVFEEARRAGAKTVWTVHNFRYACLNGLFLRDGRVCEDCLGNYPISGIVHRCYRNSALASMAVARLIVEQFKSGKIYDKIDAVIALNNFCYERLVTSGAPPDKIVVNPNYLDAELSEPEPVTKTKFVFVGRLSEEKGVDIIVDAFRKLPHCTLHVVGDGPLYESISASAPSNVKMLGRRPTAEVLATIRSAAALLLPSRFYECFPRVILEAASQGVPTVTSPGGAAASIISDYDLGIVMEANTVECWRDAVSHLSHGGTRLRNGVEYQKTFEANFSKRAAATRMRELLSVRLGLDDSSLWPSVGL